MAIRLYVFIATDMAGRCNSPPRTRCLVFDPLPSTSLALCSWTTMNNDAIPVNVGDVIVYNAQSMDGGLDWFQGVVTYTNPTPSGLRT
jgi:hypothetical protein